MSDARIHHFRPKLKENREEKKGKYDELQILIIYTGENLEINWKGEQLNTK